MNLHYIILSSSYTLGKRICLDVVDDATQANSAVTIIKESCGYDVSLSYHTIKTVSAIWSSVINKDAFFKDVKKIDEITVFINLIEKDRSLSAMDVAKYIVSITPCTNIKLQKLLYLSYADYLTCYKKHLFEGDSICALPYGPVVSTVLDFFKGRRNVLNEEDFDISQNEKLRLPARSRILFAAEGNEKLISIGNTLKNYGALSITQLIELTHGKDTPWYITKEAGHHRIKDSTILKYHINEI